MIILVLNAGSSSMKFKLFDMGKDAAVLAEGNCQRVGLKDSEIKYVGKSGKKSMLTKDLPDHSAAMDEVLRLLTQADDAPLSSLKELGAIGHRVSMGGHIASSTMIDESVVNTIKAMGFATPLHTPPQVATIEACRKLLGSDFPMVVGFDTAFHQTMPREVYTTSGPYDYYERLGVRRYGFHGLSHQFVAERYFALTGLSPAGNRMVTCHLGGGASVTAVKDGKSMDNSFGFGSGEGPMCGSRAGSFDHSAIQYILSREGISYEELEDILNRQSGLLGVSGLSSDEKELEDAAAQGHERAELALNMMAYQIKRYMGGYAFGMGGLDTVVFTGGIGENSDIMRAKICDGLEGVGIQLDKDKNLALNRSEGKISAEGSRVSVWIIPTNEELVIARDTLRIVKG